MLLPLLKKMMQDEEFQKPLPNFNPAIASMVVNESFLNGIYNELILESTNSVVNLSEADLGTIADVKGAGFMQAILDAKKEKKEAKPGVVKKDKAAPSGSITKEDVEKILKDNPVLSPFGEVLKDCCSSR